MALDAWFYRIMQNVLFDDHDFQSRKKRDYRKDKMIPDNSGSQYELGLKDTDSRPSTADNLTALKDQVNRVLAELSPEHQRIMVLIHYSSLKKEQAAVLLGIQGDAARKRYARARCRFRELWKTHYGMTGFR
jgi:RNA polymerase sigma factor (sigma-70 family)